MKAKTKAALSLVFNLGLPLTGGAVIYTFSNYLETHMRAPDYPAMKAAFVKSRIEQTVQHTVPNQLKACLDKVDRSHLAKDFSCAIDVATNTTAFNDEADALIAKKKEIAQDQADNLPKVKWGLAAFYLFAMALAFRPRVEQNVRALRAPELAKS